MRETLETQLSCKTLRYGHETEGVLRQFVLTQGSTVPKKNTEAQRGCAHLQGEKRETGTLDTI